MKFWALEPLVAMHSEMQSVKGKALRRVWRKETHTWLDPEGREGQGCGRRSLSLTAAAAADGIIVVRSSDPHHHLHHRRPSNAVAAVVIMWMMMMPLEPFILHSAQSIPPFKG
jgi:hypothetical protein